MGKKISFENFLGDSFAELFMLMAAFFMGWYMAKWGAIPNTQGGLLFTIVLAVFLATFIRYYNSGRFRNTFFDLG